MDTSKDTEPKTSSLPWDDPKHDVMADIGDMMRQEYENWPPPPWKPFYTPAEQRIIDEWERTVSSQHIVHIPAYKLSALRKWLERPNGSFRVSPRMVFEAVEGGSAWVKTSPFGYEADNETD